MKWTDAEIDQLKAKYADTPTELLATSIGRPVRQVYQKAHALGLFKSAEYLAGPHASRLRRGDNVGASYRFKKGQQAWNKGMKGLDLSGGKGQFKKGQMSGAAQHNYKPIGSFRISKDGYLEKKITDDQSIAPARRWVGVHRLVWEAANGPIPRGKDHARLPRANHTRRIDEPQHLSPIPEGDSKPYPTARGAYPPNQQEATR